MMIGRCRPTTPAVTPRPMPMLVVAAVLEAAMAKPSMTPRDLVRVDRGGGSPPYGVFGGVIARSFTGGPDGPDGGTSNSAGGFQVNGVVITCGP
ncbi:hypothetical protein GCM10010346_10570 [Streptomyces chryseus]|uniref:Secreted protein n=1 Tax=Streptomyces chryseus TaxID=68186 RepID=A0ABQ3DHK0_9ACTN|nr:hypothetical protein GCM10010346_10570 [Streptomyces chryseus]